MKYVKYGFPYWECDVKYGFDVIPVLEFLNGREYNQLAENYLEALRPSQIEVVSTSSCCATDMDLWRVRVYLDNGIIDHIEQKVKVGLEGGYNSSWDLEDALKYGFDVIPVLEFLNGREYNQLAENYFEALRPSQIEVVSTSSCCTADMDLWRVRVYLDNGIIDHIEQEVKVGLEGGYNSGWDLKSALKYGTEPGQEPPGSIVNLRGINKL